MEKEELELLFGKWRNTNIGERLINEGFFTIIALTFAEFVLKEKEKGE